MTSHSNHAREKKGEKVYVTKTYLPPIREYQKYLDEIWTTNQLTNQGPLLGRFEKEAKNTLGVDNFHFITNGTVALQIAIRALGITEGEIITTPFSYVATTSAILWQGCKPVFVDIEPDTLCIDATKIEAAITSKTKAIMAVHVFGNACDVEAIEVIARKHNIKVIYDGAHAFSVTYKSQSLLSYGDISMCSFHATKLFHTIEGGCLITKEKTVSDKIELMKRFGHNSDDHLMIGINGKASEFQAAMGLANLPHVPEIIEARKKISKLYDSLLSGKFKRPKVRKGISYNYAYYPVVFSSEEDLLQAKDALQKINVYPRRYFFPSLNKLPYIETKQYCPVSEDISKRILCLPLYSGLEEDVVKQISEVITNV